MTRLAIAHACAGLLLLFLIALPHRAFGYRPFISTDAAVADVNELEIELGYFNWEREKGKTTFISPKAVLNYGLIHNFEAVGEFTVEEPGQGSARLVDAALSVKAVVKEGPPGERQCQLCHRGRSTPAVNKQRRKTLWL